MHPNKQREDLPITPGATKIKLKTANKRFCKSETLVPTCQNEKPVNKPTIM
jgi:hypothetical protein